MEGIFYNINASSYDLIFSHCHISLNITQATVRATVTQLAQTLKTILKYSIYSFMQTRMLSKYIPLRLTEIEAHSKEF